MVSTCTFIPLYTDGHHRVTLCNRRTGMKIVWIALVLILFFYTVWDLFSQDQCLRERETTKIDIKYILFL